MTIVRLFLVGFNNIFAVVKQPRSGRFRTRVVSITRLSLTTNDFLFHSLEQHVLCCPLLSRLLAPALATLLVDCVEFQEATIASHWR